ncbi:Zinc finger protein 358 [Lucilia cuprina]|nr:Zinc finger protein 358 [Lucilia cuprina]
MTAMRSCCICKKKDNPSSGSFFSIPKDERRKKWSDACQKNFGKSAKVCMDHFDSSSFIKIGSKLELVYNAIPSLHLFKDKTTPSFSIETEEIVASNNDIFFESLCGKRYKKGNGSFFCIPKDERKAMWDEACHRILSPNGMICMDHFHSSSFIKSSRCTTLTYYAVPLVKPFDRNEIVSLDNKTELTNSDRQMSSPMHSLCPSEENIEQSCDEEQEVEILDNELHEVEINTGVTPNDYPPDPLSNDVVEDVLGENLLNINNNDLPDLFEGNPLVQIPIVKPENRSISTQTNTRLCGTVEVSECAEEYRLNCFYCPVTYPLAYYKKFISHMKKKHTDFEAAFDIPKYVSDDHDYTPIIEPPLSPPIDAIVQTQPHEPLVIEANALLPCLVRLLKSAYNPFGTALSQNSNSTIAVQQKNTMVNCNNNEQFDNFVKPAIPALGKENKLQHSYMSNQNIQNFNLPEHSKNEKDKPLKKRTIKKSRTKSISGKSKEKVLSSGVIYLTNIKRQTALSRCLKRSSTIDTLEPPEPPEDDTSPIEDANVQPYTTELSFEYTPRDIIDSMLDCMKNYPVLWEFDAEPFNDDYYEAVEELCRVINKKWSMNIDNLKMRRSVNRVLRYYWSVYPLENVENIDQFTCYYDQLAAFLPASVHEIAYSRCSHCYRCYKNDSDLRAHLLEEFRHLQWPHKCVQCKECFRDINEFEFHKSLPHYLEVFRCEQCGKRYTQRNKFNKHVSIHQIKQSSEPGKYVCNVCGKEFKLSSELRNHLVYHGERKHKCNLCPKAFFTNATLRHHLRSHNKEYRLICEVCGKGFIHHTNLREHLKKHTGAKVTCNICNLKLRKSSLMRHLRTVHIACEGTIESTYRARNHHYRKLLQWPSKLYTRRTKYKKEKEYCCKICDIHFDGHKQIVEHNKEFHNNGQKWPCKLCTSEFNRKLNLSRHYRKKHQLHAYQVFKLVDKGEDVDTVLAIKPEELDRLTETLHYSLNTGLTGANSTAAAAATAEAQKHITTETTTIIKTDPSPEEIYIEEERLHSDTIQDQIMQVVDEDNMASHDIKVDDDHYMNDFFTNLLK